MIAAEESKNKNHRHESYRQNLSHNKVKIKLTVNKQYSTAELFAADNCLMNAKPNNCTVATQPGSVHRLL